MEKEEYKWKPQGFIIIRYGEGNHEYFLFYYENLQVQSKILNDFANTKFRRTVYAMSGKVLIEDTTAEDDDKVFTKVEIEASFPGGPNAWQRYVTKQIMEHADGFNDNDYGT